MQSIKEHLTEEIKGGGRPEESAAIKEALIKKALIKCAIGALRLFSATTALRFLEINTIIPAKPRLVVAKNFSQIALVDLISPSLNPLRPDRRRNFRGFLPASGGEKTINQRFLKHYCNCFERELQGQERAVLFRKGYLRMTQCRSAKAPAGPHGVFRLREDKGKDAH